MSWITNWRFDFDTIILFRNCHSRLLQSSLTRQMCNLEKGKSSKLGQKHFLLSNLKKNMQSDIKIAYFPWTLPRIWGYDSLIRLRKSKRNLEKFLDSILKKKWNNLHKSNQKSIQNFPKSLPYIHTTKTVWKISKIIHRKPRIPRTNPSLTLS